MKRATLLGPLRGTLTARQETAMVFAGELDKITAVAQ